MRTFLLIDDHVVVRMGIKKLLSHVYDPCEVFEAGDEETAMDLLSQRKYDIVLLDIQMPNSDSLRLAAYMQTNFPDTGVLVFSMCPEHIYAKRFLKAGVKGYLSKESPLPEIQRAINLALHNRRYISDSLAQTLAESATTPTFDSPFAKLSQRENEITTLLLQGNSLSTVCKFLQLKSSTVGTHKARIFEKLKVNNILELKSLATHYSL